jgi:hypothetical protein
MRSLPICLASSSAPDQIAQSLNTSPIRPPLRREQQLALPGPAADLQTSMPFFTHTGDNVADSAVPTKAAQVLLKAPNAVGPRKRRN